MNESQVNKDVHLQKDDGAFVSPAFDPLAIGDEGDVEPSPEQTSAIVSILVDAGICCCFVQEFTLLYYGTRRLARDRILCVPDEQLDRAVELFTSKSDILKPCGPLPLRRTDMLNHKNPRFKAIGRTDFWLLLPASYCHITCEPDNVEWSLGGLHYPKLPMYVQSLMETKNGVDLEDLVDGMNLSDKWGEENLDLEGYTDTKWLEGYYEAFREDGREEMFIYVDPTPISLRQVWQETVRNKQRRMGWKYPPEKYATRFRRHDATMDPRTRHIPGL